MNTEAPPSRLIAFDAARAVAFAGMVVVNYRIVMDPRLSLRDPEWLAQGLDEVTGKAAALFVMLAGAGTTLLLRSKSNAKVRGTGIVGTMVFVLSLAVFTMVAGFNAFTHTLEGRQIKSLDFETRWRTYFDVLEAGGGREWLYGVAGLLFLVLLAGATIPALRSSPRWRLVRRGLFLFALGWAWYPLWTGDILHFYGLFFVGGALCSRLKTPWLLGLAAATVAVASLWQWHEDFLAHWSLLILEQPEIFRPDIFAKSLFFNGWHPFFPWFAFYLVGLVLGRCAIDRAKTLLLLMAVGAVFVVGVNFASPRALQSIDDSEMHALDSLLPDSAPDLPEAAIVGVIVPDLNPRSRIGIDVASEIDREENSALIVDTRRLRRYLRAVRERIDYAGVALEIVSDDSRALLRLVLDEDPRVKLAPEREALFRDVTRKFAIWMAGRRDLMPFGTVADSSLTGLTSSWPKAIERLVIVRRCAVRWEDNERLSPIGEITLVQSELDGFGETYAKSRALVRTRSFPEPSPLFVLGAMGNGLVILALVGFVAMGALGRKFLWPFVVAGQAALTLYVAHIVIGLTILDGVGYLKEVTLPEIAFSVFTCVVVGVAGAVAWRAFFRRGPLELLLRLIAG